MSEEARWTTRAAMAHNGNLAIGALALDGGDFVVRHVLPLHDLAAGSLRTRITGERQTAPMGFWAE